MTDEEWDDLMKMIAVEREARDNNYATAELWMVLDMLINEAQRLRAEILTKT